jgi:hypothetical protein
MYLDVNAIFPKVSSTAPSFLELLLDTGVEKRLSLACVA